MEEDVYPNPSLNERSMAGHPISIRTFILGLLTQQPMSGYDIKRFLKSLSWLIGSPSFGSLYPALRALLEEELVTVDVMPREGKPPRKIYNVTEAGRHAFGEQAGRCVVADVSLKTFVMYLILSDSLSIAELLACLRRRRDQVAVHLESVQHALAHVEHQQLALDYGLAMAEAELAWLDELIERLVREQPVNVAGGEPFSIDGEAVRQNLTRGEVREE